VTLANEVECDEAYVITGHKGQPEMVKSKERKDVDADLKAKVVILEKGRPPVFGMVEALNREVQV
jgi:hypothetical protein